MTEVVGIDIDWGGVDEAGFWWVGGVDLGITGQDGRLFVLKAGLERRVEGIFVP